MVQLCGGQTVLPAGEAEGQPAGQLPVSQARPINKRFHLISHKTKQYIFLGIKEIDRYIY